MLLLEKMREVDNLIYTPCILYTPMFVDRPFYKNLLRSSTFVNWISVRFNDTECIWPTNGFIYERSGSLARGGHKKI